MLGSRSVLGAGGHGSHCRDCVASAQVPCVHDRVQRRGSAERDGLLGPALWLPPGPAVTL